MDDDMDMKDSLMEEDDAHISEHVHWLPKLVVAATIFGFVALAWYAYRTGTQSVNDADLVVVEADKTPLKEKPDDPGGMKFPNQDKTIFETFSGNNQAPARVERVMPSPEEPMQRPLDTSDAKTWVNEKIQKQEAAAVAPAPAQPELIVGTLPNTPPADQANVKVVQAPSAPVKTAEQKSAAVEFKPAQSAKEVVSYSKNKPSEKVKELAPAAAPKVVDTGVIEVTSSNLEATPEAPAEVPAEKPATKPVAKPAAKPAAKPVASTGKVKVQLGAYRSESEARGAFSKLQKKFSSLSGRSPVIVKADLGDKGIYYRLRVGGFATDADAKKFCGNLSAKGQACIIAK